MSRLPAYQSILRGLERDSLLLERLGLLAAGKEIPVELENALDSIVGESSPYRNDDHRYAATNISAAIAERDKLVEELPLSTGKTVNETRERLGPVIRLSEGQAERAFVLAQTAYDVIGYVISERDSALARLRAAESKLTAAAGGQGCPSCLEPEVESNGPHTTYACGSKDYDQRPGTFQQSKECENRSSDKSVSVPVEVTACRQCPHYTNSSIEHNDPFTSTPLSSNHWCKRLDVRLPNPEVVDSRCPFWRTAKVEQGRVEELLFQLRLAHGCAPGDYSFVCIECKEQKIGDKRSLMCEPCANARIVALLAASPETGGS